MNTSRLGRVVFSAVLCVLGMAAVSSAHAVVSIAGFNFNDDAFADSVSNAAPGFTLLNGAPNISAALTGSDTSTGISYFGAFPGSVDIGFTDNVIVNAAGDDLIIFEFGNNQDSLDVTIGGTTLGSGLSVVTAFNSGFNGFNIYYWAVDLSNFGIAAGATVNALTLSNFDLDGDGTSATPSVLGALNSRSVSVPEPDALALVVVSLVGLGFVRQKRQKRV